MTRGRLRTLPLVIGPLLGLAAAAPAAAGTLPSTILPALPAAHAGLVRTIPDTGPSARAGFVTYDDPGIQHQTTYNSAGGVVSVTPLSTGQYQVVFKLLGFPGGDVQVTPIEPGVTCAVQNWFQSSADLDVNVDCYDGTGAPVSSAFSLLVTQPVSAPNGVLDYDWVYSGAHGKLLGGYQYNSSHKSNSVTHPHTGQYVVFMPGPGLTGAARGTVKVSPYGAGGGTCQVAGWKFATTGQQVTVDCFSAAGAPQDRQFTVVYARGNNLMGQNGKTDANAYATRTAGLYQPVVQYDSRTGARVSVAHLDRGVYEVLLTGSSPTGHFSGGLGNLQFTPVAALIRYCVAIDLPTHNPFVLITCVNHVGQRVDTPFLIQWVVN